MSPDERNSHNAGREETNNAQLLAPGEVHLEDGKCWQNKDDDVENAVDEDTAEEEDRLVNGAGSIDGLVPDIANRQTLEDGQAGANYDPEHSHHKEHLDREADHGELEDAPVEGEEGDLGGGDGGGIAEGSDPHVETRPLYLVLGSVGVAVMVDMRSKAIVDCCWT